MSSSTPPIKIKCAKCKGQGTYHGGPPCWRCKGKGDLNGDDLNRNAKYDTETDGIAWIIHLSRGNPDTLRREKTIRTFGPNTEVFVRDDLTHITGTRTKLDRAGQLHPGQIITIGHIETGELLEAVVETIKQPGTPGIPF